MMQAIGQKKYGVDMTDIFLELKEKLKNKIDYRVLDRIIEYYNSSFFYDRDVFCSNLLWNNFDKSISNILIVGGNIPIIYLDKFKNYNLTFIDNNPALFYVKDYIKEKYNCDVIYDNPITCDLSNLIEKQDLIIYPETETLVPFDLLRYNHNNKIVFCSNFLRYPFKINNNLAYSEEDLIDICGITNIILKGNEFLNINTRKVYYVMGHAS